MSKYYDGTKLLSLTDLEGKKPEIFMVTTNRTGGKTTYFGRLAIRRFLNYGEKFALLYRYNYELDNAAEKFFKDLKTLFFPEMEMTSKRLAHGIFHELYLDDVSCGYAITLNSADQIKKYSHFFSDVQRILFDEFQSETDHYCDREVTKFQSIHTSIARGQGKQTRYVPVYMMSNPVTLLNPYYSAMKIGARLQDNTKFLRGNGWVLEQGYVESASKAMQESGFARAFADDDYMKYSTEAVYLNDNYAFVESMQGKCKYVCTLRYMGKEYGVKEFVQKGVVYVDDKPDVTYPYKITVTTEDHQINYLMLQRHDMFIMNMRFLFSKGAFRFKNLECKEATLAALSYR
nr:MAG TPA: Terminase [Caudoviricetes sp.]